MQPKYPPISILHPNANSSWLEYYPPNVAAPLQAAPRITMIEEPEVPSASLRARGLADDRGALIRLETDNAALRTRVAELEAEVERLRGGGGADQAARKK
jgi:hypothetical protein